MPSITVTGVDERTSVSDIRRMLDLGAEVAFLWSETPEGRNRYPSSSWIWDMADHLDCERLALHVCGSAARKQLLADVVDLSYFGRVQINGVVTFGELNRIYFNEHDKLEIITQDNSKNKPLRDSCLHYHSILVDGSGGRGIKPKKWERPCTLQKVGFAGGLGPDNLREELPKIAFAAGGSDYWIDMESGVRTNEFGTEDSWFDVGKAINAILIFNEFVQNKSRPSDFQPYEVAHASALQCLRWAWEQYSGCCGVDKEPWYSAFNEMMDGVK